VRAASEVFMAAGVDVSLEEIARQAGVGAATLYRHFATKEDLVRAVLEQAFAEQVEPVLQSALHDDGNAGVGLVRVIEAALRMAAANRPRLVAMLITTMWFDESGDEWRRYLSLLADALVPGAASPLPPLGAAARSGFPPPGQIPYE
jgi:AcrR family transcriptional regulator